MDQGLTVGILSPFVGGDYYGTIIAGVTQAVAVAGGRVIAIQTLDPGSYSADASGIPDFRWPVSWQHVSGFVVITGAVDNGYLRSIRAAGKPAVLVSNEDPDPRYPSVIPDNWTGIQKAVDHLVEHGHRRIAFAGYLDVSDIHERFTAYRGALRRNGLDDDPALLYLTVDNHESGGDLAAARMLRAGMPSTAVIAGTDRNAIGIVRTLTTAGYVIPRDQAVVGFDDIPAARFLTPTLSSVQQPLEELGQLAVDLLLAQLRGETVPAGPQRTPTSFMARESCGCSRSALPTDGARTVAARPASRDRMMADLTAVVPPARLRRAGPDDLEHVANGADAVLDLLHGAVNGSPLPSEAQLRPILDELYRFGAQPQLVTEIAQTMREFVDDMPSGGTDDSSVRRVERCLQQLILVLAHAQARMQFEDITVLQSMMNTQYELGMELLRSHENDPRSLDWLERSNARGGVLGLWHPDPDPAADHSDRSAADPTLRIAGEFQQRPGAHLDTGHPHPASNPSAAGNPAPASNPSAAGNPAPADHLADGVWPAAGDAAVSAFPPTDLFSVADEWSGNIVFVVPVRSETRDWGMLAAVTAIQSATPPGRELMNQSGALLAVALDRDTMLRSLREQEERLRQAALYDQLTGLPNRGLFLDRMRQAALRAKRQPGHRFSVLFLDLDGFKAVNDSLGHAAGDELLIQVAKRISVDMRDADTAARFGGDEFLILLDGVADDHIPELVMARLHRGLAEPFDLDGHRVTISGSIGSATSTEYDTAEDLLRAADTAMYRAKSSKRHG